MPSNDTTVARGGLERADETARRTLVARQQADVLYGNGDTTRLHLVSTTSVALPREVLGVELLLGPPSPRRHPQIEGLMAIHVSAPGKDGDALVSHLDLVAADSMRRVPAPDLWERVRAHCPEEMTFDVDQPVRRISYACVDTAPREVDQTSILIAYALISGLRAERMGELAARAARHDFTVTRTDWSALVLRDGAAFVSHQSSAEPFAPTLRALTHTVHVDAILLALTQRRLVDLSGEAAVEATLENPGQLSDLEKSHFDFKRKFWRTSLTDKRTAPADEIFRAFQRELLTPQDVSDVEERVNEGARVARTLHSEAVDKAQGQLTRTVQNATVVLGAFGLAYTAAPTLAQPSVGLFALATLVGIVGVLAAFAVLVVSGRRAHSRT